MDPLVTGGLIGAGASLAGGLLGAKEGKKLRKQELAAQKEFAQHGVRWRVEDAKAAGLHPLYALGAQLPSFTPTYTSGASLGSSLAEAGQTVGRAVSSLQTSAEREAQALQLDVLRKQLEESDARIGALNSEAFRNMQEANASAAFPSVSGSALVPEGQAPQVNRGMVSVVPSEVGTASRDDVSVGAGTNYAWRRYMVAPDFGVLLPGGPQGNIEEALESVTESIPAMVAVIAENLSRNPSFTRDAVRHYMGNEAAQLYDVIRKSGLATPGRAIDAVRGVRDSVRGWSDRFRSLSK